MRIKPVYAGIVARLTIVVGILVLCTALIVYAGADLSTAWLYKTQRETRMRLLARSMTYGIKNILASAEAEGAVSSIVRDVLQRAMSADPSIIGCEVFDRKGRGVFFFFAPGVNKAGVQSVTVDVVADDEKTGKIFIYYLPNDVLSNEKTQQIVAVGATVASMAGYYLKKLDYFQVRFMAESIIHEDPDVLYGIISDPDGKEIFSYNLDRYKNYLKKQVNQRAAGVSAIQPIVVQEIGFSTLYGAMVEVAVLINSGDRRLGVVRIGYSTKNLTSALARSRFVISLLIIGFTLVAFGAALFLARNITRPLALLTSIARSVSPHEVSGDSRIDIEEAEKEIRILHLSLDQLGAKLISRQDEVGDLAAAFRGMAQNLDRFINRLKLFYQKIGAAERLFAMGQLSAGIAHEINNPLTVISTYTQIILKNPNLDPELREDMENIREEISRISEKVKDLLSFAQESRLKFTVIDIASILGRTLDMCRHQLKKQDIALKTFFSPDDNLLVMGDGGKLKQVFLNLIINAVQATSESERKELSVFAGRNGANVEISFTDTGAGIKPENIDKIFDPFFTTKQPGVGTGLGLAICYNIAAAHNGSLTAESTPGEGATFRVILPAELETDRIDEIDEIENEKE